MAKIDVSSYVVTDPFFGAPYIDVDEDLDHPLPHRRVHGGFVDTDTRFTFYYPTDGSYDGRLIQPLEGAHAGHENVYGSPQMDDRNGFPAVARLGAYMVESNMGHIGDDIDPRAGNDPTLYGFRAAAESARFSKFVAAAVYGTPPGYAYVYGGSGGARRSPLCLENAPDVWDGALPFMGGGEVAEHGNTKCIRSAGPVSFGTMFNVQRLLGPKVVNVADAMAPGGSGNPFEGLTSHQREELASLYRQGFPRGDEFIIGEPFGQVWLWTSMADMLEEQDPSYFENFWTKPGYVGHDHPELVAHDVIDVKSTVLRVLSAKDLQTSPEFASAEFTSMRTLSFMLAANTGNFDLPVAIEVAGLGDGYRLGTGVRMLTGGAAGRQLYALGSAGNVLSCDGHGEANLQRFNGVLAGDEVHVDNRKFLAFCYFARHHLLDEPQFDALRVDGRPIYPQHPVPTMSPLMGVAYSGQFKGKLLWIHHTHDASLWPPQGVVYREAVLNAQGPAGADERFRLRWTENAEHMTPLFIPGAPNRAANTWLIDYSPIIEQSLHDLIEWVERGVVPAHTNFVYADGSVSLPGIASERRGIQPVVAVTANGSVRAEVAAGETVTLNVLGEVPPGAGTVVSVEWDFDGSGTYPYHHDGIDGTATAVDLSTTHTYDRPGTYFATARVSSRRDGDVANPTRRIPNLAQARIVVS
ncbi:MAG: hypothetical protein JWL70_216 [Acidimicrobiia bacterium]|nr:hypothetical protein [Acidimicrobiia bacterium]